MNTFDDEDEVPKKKMQRKLQNISRKGNTLLKKER